MNQSVGQVHPSEVMVNHAASEDNGAATLPKRPKDDDSIVNHQRHRGLAKKEASRSRVVFRPDLEMCQKVLPRVEHIGSS